MNQRLKFYAAIGAGVIVLLAAAWIAAARFFTKTEPVQTEPVARGTVRLTVQATATVTPENKLEIIPPIAGRAESVEVDIGAKVKEGQVLAWMSSTERAALLDAARAKGEKELAFWKDVYKATPVVAPLDGTVISRNVVPGQVLQTTTNIFVMSDRLIVQADLDETDLGKIKMDQRADVTLDGFPGEQLQGKVSKIAYASVTVNNVNTYKVDVHLDQIPEFLRSGMTANVSFIIAEKRNVLVVSGETVQDNTVMILPPGKDKAEPRTIQTGLSDGKLTEVVSGLSEGEQVVTSTYKLQEASKSGGFSLMPKMPKRQRGGGSPPPP